MRSLSEQGVEFQSHIDGSLHLLTPERVVEIQAALGSDVAMVLDECPDPNRPREYIEQSVQLTSRWAGRCKEARNRLLEQGVDVGVLFGIVQGGLYPDLRRKSLEDLLVLDFPGYAIGGLSVGEKKEAYEKTLNFIAPLLPADRPRYLMGVGTPADFLTAVEAGVDMFDCVMPTRAARNAAIFTSEGRVSIRRSEFKNDNGPLEDQCDCYACRRFPRSYLRHLFMAGEILGPMLATMHNLRFFMRFMEDLRSAIERDEFEHFRKASRERLRVLPTEAQSAAD